MRVWIISALAVGLAVGLTLWLTRDSSDADAAVDRKPQPPPALQENEVLAYLQIMPRVHQVLGRSATELRRQHQETGRYPTQAERALGTQTAIRQLLSDHHMSPEGFTTLRKRVEYVVDIMRAEASVERRNQELDDRILDKEKVLKITTGETRTQLEKDLEALRAQRTAPASPPLLDRDRKLVMRFWKQLDPIAPRLRPK